MPSLRDHDPTLTASPTAVRIGSVFLRTRTAMGCATARGARLADGSNLVDTDRDQLDDESSWPWHGSAGADTDGDGIDDGPESIVVGTSPLRPTPMATAAGRRRAHAAGSFLQIVTTTMPRVACARPPGRVLGVRPLDAQRVTASSASLGSEKVCGVRNRRRHRVLDVLRLGTTPRWPVHRRLVSGSGDVLCGLRPAAARAARRAARRFRVD